MKAKIFLAVAVVLIPLTAAYAQKVVVEGNKVIIDASAIANTRVKKARITQATNNSMAPDDINDIASKKSDRQVYYRFEVSRENNSNDFIHSSNAMDWESAIEHCEKMDRDGLGWRLPTRRELLLMWVLKAELEQVNGFDKFRENAYYKSATEYFTINNYVTSFKNGYSTWNGLKPSDSNLYPSHVRCIRDL